MDQEDAIRPEEAAANPKLMSQEEKLRLIRALRGCTAGGPSMCDELLEDRRREHERELARDGW